ncbi:UNVERIFIED_CONTAM: hypothetical protein GTU68_030338 [Idotea baltica]|nr:hypothetical protein [Idotea baltica]
MAFREQLLKSWHQPNLLTLLLWPLSLLYRILFSLRNAAYKLGLKKSYRAPVPVIVVGNITVGGTGKTPMVLYLVELLRQQGFNPGVISRGYSGTSESYPLTVLASTPVADCGDEPALIVKRSNVPMVVGSERAASIKKLLNEFEVDVIISDDGLQHLAMQRDIEICLQDLTKNSRNNCLLPAGPYREPQSRLQTVDMIVQHIPESGLDVSPQAYAMSLVAGQPTSLIKNDDLQWSAAEKVHAVAGIGNPHRFFNTCRSLGLDIIEHAFADHHHFKAADIEFDDALPVLMTEKDAVKCVDFADQQHWYLPVNAKLAASFNESLLKLLKTKMRN